MNKGCRFSLKIGLKESPRAFFGPGPVKLLILVDKYKSLHKAAAEMKMAYSKAWKIIKEAEKGFGFPLLKSVIGGIKGGGSEVTEKGLMMVRAYKSMNDRLQEYSEELYDEYVTPILEK